MTAVARMLPLVTIVCLGCPVTNTDPQNDVCTKSTGISQPTGHLHGHECQNDSECQYGWCNKAAMQLAGATGYGVCTKDCACGAGSQCDADNATGMSFTCIKRASGAGSECAIKCTSVADCTKINPKFTACVTGIDGVFSAGASKACTTREK